MYHIPWQTKQDIARARLEDASRAVRYAYLTAGSRRRPTRRIAAILRWVSDQLADAVRRRAPNGRAAAIERPHGDVRRPDAKLTVVAVNALDDALAEADVLEGGPGALRRRAMPA